MALGRRKVSLSDPSRWVFNRMAALYDARPPYPDALIEALLPYGPRVLELGAGIGHLAIPLAQRGCQVTAVEPAQQMLAELVERAQGLSITALHAQAEVLPLDGPFELALLADALHFVDAERTGLELARVQASVLAIVRVEPAASPYMAALQALLDESAPRRLRATRGNAAQLTALAGRKLHGTQVFRDEHALDHEALVRLLGTISFVRPAISASFLERVRALGPALYARKLTLELYR
ncbi:MAG TPA: methyltransferase domain-containing protein [Polyangiales bacterium]|nr:methyltransferase domain-containing protein [Polyangiales bacterium]